MPFRNQVRPRKGLYRIDRASEFYADIFDGILPFLMKKVSSNKGRSFRLRKRKNTGGYVEHR